MKKTVLAISIATMVFACSKNSHAPVSNAQASMLGKWDFVNEVSWDNTGTSYTSPSGPGEYLQFAADGKASVCWALPQGKHMYFSEPYAVSGAGFRMPDFPDNSTVSVSEHSLVITSLGTSPTGNDNQKWTFTR